MGRGLYQAKTSRKDKMRGIFIGSLFLIAFVLLFSPYLMRVCEKEKLNQNIETFRQKVSVYHTISTVPTGETVPKENVPLQYADLLEAMQRYNAEIYANGQIGLNNRYGFRDVVIDLAEYGISDGIVGVVSIPRLDVEMPLFLAGTNEHLAKGFAQFSYTSMPIGGESTNCLINAHRGWRGMPYLREVERLQRGDSVFVQNLWERMEYKVMETYIATATDPLPMLIQDGKDLLTLATCHPYGISTHRYIVVCERYNPEEISNQELDEAVDETTGYWSEEVIQSVVIHTGAGQADEEGDLIAALIAFVTDYAPWLSLGCGLFAIFIYFRKRQK